MNEADWPSKFPELNEALVRAERAEDELAAAKALLADTVEIIELMRDALLAIEGVAGNTANTTAPSLSAWWEVHRQPTLRMARAFLAGEETR